MGTLTNKYCDGCGITLKSSNFHQLITKHYAYSTSEIVLPLCDSCCHEIHDVVQPIIQYVDLKALVK